MPTFRKSDVFDVGSNSLTQGRSENGLFHVHTRYFDDVALQRNRDIAASGMLERSKLGLHDNEDMRGVISCPSVEQWNQFKKKNPDVYALLTSKQEHDRVRAVQLIDILHPDWVIYSRQ